jgi:hypothetical protein
MEVFFPSSWITPWQWTIPMPNRIPKHPSGSPEESPRRQWVQAAHIVLLLAFNTPAGIGSPRMLAGPKEARQSLRHSRSDSLLNDCLFGFRDLHGLRVAAPVNLNNGLSVEIFEHGTDDDLVFVPESGELMGGQQRRRKIGKNRIRGQNKFQRRIVQRILIGRDLHQVREDPSGRGNRNTKVPCSHPSTSVSRIALAFNIFGRWGSWAKEPAKSFTRLTFRPAPIDCTDRPEAELRR